MKNNIKRLLMSILTTAILACVATNAFAQKNKKDACEYMTIIVKENIPFKLTMHISRTDQKEMSIKDKFKLITRRAVTTHNSWTHNNDRMLSHGRDTNYAYLHPDDMLELGVAEMTWWTLLPIPVRFVFM